MTVLELIEKLQAIQAEIGGDADSIGSHKTRSSVEVYVDDRDIDIDFEVSGVEPTTRIGCGCWDGAVIKLKRVFPLPLQQENDK